MKNKTKVLLSSLAAIAMSASLAAGATYALFTSEDRVNIAVTSGKVKINANVDVNSMEMWSREVTGLTGTWVNGGTADLTEEDVTLELITPGDGISFNIDVTNESNVAIQYRTVVACETGAALYEGLTVSLDYLGDTQADAQKFDGITAYGAWTALAGGVGAVDTVKVTIEFPYLETDQNKYQDLATKIYFRVEAVQGNADVTDQTATTGETIAYTATDLELIARKVANGDNMSGQTITLGDNIDLSGPITFAMRRSAPVSNWMPIGTAETPFAGTFDGNGYTISNMIINEPETPYVGLFGCVDGATIKNVTLENASVTGLHGVGALIGKISNAEVIGCAVEDATLSQVREGALEVGVVAGCVEEGSQNAISGVNVSGDVTVNGETAENAPTVGGAVEEGSLQIRKAIAEGLTKADNSSEVYVENEVGFQNLNKLLAVKDEKNYFYDATIVINADLDMTGFEWTPVEHHSDFNCGKWTTIDGKGHTISNLTINGQAMFKRFAIGKDVTIKDVTFDNATVNSTGINSSILVVQTYCNVLLDNVDVKNSTITGTYKVAPLIATVYNESASAITATLKDCDVENVTVKATKYDFCTTGMVAFVYADDNDTVVFENCTVKNVKLCAPDDSYKAHAAIYTTGSETLFDEAEGVTVENVMFEALN